MDLTVMFSLVLVGGGAAAAGFVGLFLPSRERLTAVLSLILGAGVGVIAIAIGVYAIGPQSEGVFLTACVAGFAGVVGGLAILWHRTRRAAAIAEPPSA